MQRSHDSSNEVTLYHYDNSVCSAKVRVALHEKAIAWNDVHLDIMKGEHFTPDYLALNPKAVVPTLLHNGTAVVESTLIVEYLDEAFPAPALKPPAPLERALVRQYPKLCDEGLHQAVAVFSAAAVFLERMRGQPAEEVAARLIRIVDLERRDRQTALYQQGLDAPHVYRGVVAFEKAFQKINKTLMDGRPWLAGETMSLAEINLCPYFARLEHLDILNVWIPHYGPVAAWYRRIAARPSFQKELVARIAPADLRGMLEGGRRIKQRIGEMRAHYLATDLGASVF